VKTKAENAAYMREWRQRNLARVRENERQNRAKHAARRSAVRKERLLADTFHSIAASLQALGVTWRGVLIAYALDMRARRDERARISNERIAARRAIDPEYDAKFKARDRRRHERDMAERGDAIRAADRERYARDPEGFKARSLKRRAAAPESHREKKLELKHARRAKMVGRYTAEDIAAIVNEQDGCCYYCGRALSRDRKERHVDHMTPVSRGGTNWPDNIAVACADCNLRKGALTADEFLLRRRAAA
jgi:5-methylcytosine-specific restriction endonuclease McrA